MMKNRPVSEEERIAAAFQDAYSGMSLVFGVEGVPKWEGVSEVNKRVMISAVIKLIGRDVIRPGGQQ